MFASRAGVVARNFSTSLVRRAGHGKSYPGQNLPFDITSRYKLTLVMTVFLGSAFSLPFFVFHKRHTA